MKKVLFVVNGFGLGNSSRCDAIISLLLEKNIKISVICSGNSLTYFNSIPYRKDIDIFEFHPLSYGSYHAKFSLLATLLSLPQIIAKMILNKYRLFKILSKNRFSAIVIDSDYTITLAKFFLKPPVIAINNSEFVIRQMWTRKPKNYQLWPQFLVELCDYLYHRLVPTVVLQPDIIFPIVRAGLIPNPARKKIRNIVVMLGGSVLSQNTDFLENLPDVGARYYFVGDRRFKNSLIESVGHKLHNVDILNFADAFITNAGFSTISECAYLCKPSVTVPIENHAEQYINARYFDDMGFGIHSSRDEIKESVYKMIERWRESCEPSSARQRVDRIEPKSGSVKAAEFIYGKLHSV